MISHYLLNSVLIADGIIVNNVTSGLVDSYKEQKTCSKDKLIQLSQSSMSPSQANFNQILFEIGFIIPFISAFLATLIAGSGSWYALLVPFITLISGLIVSVLSNSEELFLGIMFGFIIVGLNMLCAVGEAYYALEIPTFLWEITETRKLTIEGSLISGVIFFILRALLIGVGLKGGISLITNIITGALSYLIRNIYNSNIHKDTLKMTIYIITAGLFLGMPFIFLFLAWVGFNILEVY
ncbi:MAG: hypothetical protein GF329_04215 [Candidatus Lokiarchaeota archaeon]|nr:hypothetical protein [Candidatus Lokiarchaeota archaeon]